jgi:hypothetical protein
MATQEITNLTSEIKLLEGKIEGKQGLIEFLQQELDTVPASKFQKTQMLYDLRLEQTELQHNLRVLIARKKALTEVAEARARRDGQ